MRKHRGMKISVKLIITFLVIALFAGGVCVFGAIMISEVNEASNSTFSNYGNAQGYLGNIFGHFQMQRALLRDMVLARDPEKAVQVSQELAASDKVLMQNLDMFKATCITQEDKAVYSELSESVEAFRGVRDNLAVSCTEGDFDNAYQWILADSQAGAAAVEPASGTGADAVSEATQEDGAAADGTAAATGEVDVVASATVSANAKSAVENAMATGIARAESLLKEQSSRVYQAELGMIVLAAAAVALALVLGYVISRGIVRPLGTAAERLDRMAQGEDVEDVDPRRFKGELRIIAESINALRASLNMMLEDSYMLSQSAMAGQLSARADAGRHKGGYRRMIEGVNGTLDAMLGPIHETSAVLGEMAKGNLSVRVEGDYSGDHAEIKNALNDTIGTLSGYIHEISAVLGEMAHGNMDVGIESDYRGEFVSLKESINHIAESLNSVLSEINIAADQVAAGMRQVSDGNQEISSGAAEQAAAIEQLTASVSEIA